MFSRTSARNGIDAPLGDAECFAERRVDFRQMALLDLVDDGLEARRLSREVLRLVFVRKAKVKLALLAGGGATHTLFEIRQQAAGAEDDHEVLALAAFECFTADAALEIDRDAVAVLAAARDFLPVRALLAQALDHRVDIGFTDGGSRPYQPDGSQVLQLDLRKHLEGRGVAQVVRLAGLLRLDTRAARRLKLLLPSASANVSRMRSETTSSRTSRP